jgi:hypothetical protein
MRIDTDYALFAGHFCMLTGQFASKGSFFRSQNESMEGKEMWITLFTYDHERFVFPLQTHFNGSRRKYLRIPESFASNEMNQTTYFI